MARNKKEINPDKCVAFNNVDTQEADSDEVAEATPEKSTVLIKPTIGRVVLYNDGYSAQRCAGMIAFVHNDECINISYVDQFGNSLNAMNVRLVHGDECEQGCAEWMDYQKEQAKK